MCQLDGIQIPWVNLNRNAALLGNIGEDEFIFLDCDDTIIEVHGNQKQGSGYGYSGVRGLNALLPRVSTKDSAPFIAVQRLGKGRRTRHAEPKNWSTRPYIHRMRCG